MVVVDSSVLVKWFIPEPDSTLAMALCEGQRARRSVCAVRAGRARRQQFITLSPARFVRW